MGRYNFRPLRVRETAGLLMKVQPATPTPPWYQTMTEYPPSQILVRTNPVQHKNTPHISTARQRPRKYKKPSKMYQPQTISYLEDKLRRDFFVDHPWELANPRILLENDGRDHEKRDWTLSEQPDRPLDGESVIQRQHHLMQPSQSRDTQGRTIKVAGLTKEKAYDQARKEFYAQRHYDQVEQRVAREEAIAMGAYFGKNSLDVGMYLEGQTFEEWKTWAHEQVTLMEQQRLSAYSGLGTMPSTDAPTEQDSLENAVDSLSGEGEAAVENKAE